MKLKNSFYYFSYKDLEKRGVSFADVAKKKNYYNQLGFLFEKACRNNPKTRTEALFIRDLALRSFPNPSFLDMACGTGRHARILSQLGYDVTGVDNSKKLLTFAKRKDKKTKYIQSDMRKFNLNQKFDCIYCLWDAYVYLSKDDEMFSFIKNCHKHLNKNGILILQSRNFQNTSLKRDSDETDFKVENFTVNLTRKRFTHIKDRVHEGIFMYKIESESENYLIVDQELVRTYSLKDLKKFFKGLFKIVASSSVWIPISFCALM